MSSEDRLAVFATVNTRIKDTRQLLKTVSFDKCLFDDKPVGY